MNSCSVVQDLPHQLQVWVCSWKGRMMMGITLPSAPLRVLAMVASLSSQPLNFFWVSLPVLRISATT